MSRLYPVVILAGGLATRLQPLTQSIPKSLVDIHGKPFIYHQLTLLKKQGVQHVILCIGHLGEQIKDYVQEGADFGLQVDYSTDGQRLLGTAGAIKRALPLVGPYFMVIHGDSYLNCDLYSVQAAFQRSHRLALMTVYRNHDQWDKSNIEFSEGEILNYDKINQTKLMQHIDYGLGVFNQAAFEPIPDNEPYDLALLYQTLLKQKQLASYEIQNRFYEVGSFSGINDLKQFILST
ncbi:MAG: NTP transferase domain-containing protein [Proteobacteria bacterium]|nr:NTP transferase domain-containing protein [Pseudomonadota bacterium]